jgi:hypothetical protein
MRKDRNEHVQGCGRSERMRDGVDTLELLWKEM